MWAVMAGSFFSALRRRGGLVLLPAVLAAGVAFTLSTLSTDMYRASAQVLVDAGVRSITSEAAVASSSAVVDEVREIIGDEPDLQVDVVDELRGADLHGDELEREERGPGGEHPRRRVRRPEGRWRPGDRTGDRAVGARSNPRRSATRSSRSSSGLLIGVVAALVVSRLDTTIRSSRKLGAIAGVPNLAVIPRVPAR